MYEYVKINYFKESKKIEEDGYERQNDFYIKHFGHLPNRITWEEDSKFQSSDRDLEIMNMKGEKVIISEKNRTKDYADTLFEIYSSFNDSTKGWAMHSTAKVLAYFMPSSIILLDLPTMVKMLSDPYNKITSQVENIDSGTKEKDIWIYGKPYPARIIKSYNPEYFSLSIAFSDKQLKKLGVWFKRF